MLLDADVTVLSLTDGLATGVGFTARADGGRSFIDGLLGVGWNDEFTIGRRE